MGICCSKNKPSLPQPPPSPNPISNDPPKPKPTKEKRGEAAASQQVVASEPVEKKPIFTIAPNKKLSIPSPTPGNETNELQHPPRKSHHEEHGSHISKPSPTPEDLRPAPLRTSSCTKEEVDAILIQCGRLSRSSSGSAGHHRRYSGSKRSYDFDNEGGGDELEKMGSRPSPQRRTPSRERNRSGSRERGNSGGGRKVSRSPGRRSDGPASNLGSGDRSRPPGKMVSVPAREKGSGVSVTTKRSSSPAAGEKRGVVGVGGVRNASPRAQSPAKVCNENSVNYNDQLQPQSLSRSSSRKAEQSPCRRNPMSEIDNNAIRVEQQHPSRNQNGSDTNKLQKRSQSQTQSLKASENSAQMSKFEQRNSHGAEISNGSKGSNPISNCVHEQAISCRSKEQQTEAEIVEESSKANKGASITTTVVESLNVKTITRSRSSRRSSKDLDQILGLQPDANYNSLLLEDINQYHHQNTTAFSLPACVSKACSILEAVADLNSSISDTKSTETERSKNDNGRFGRSLVQREPFIESEIAVKDDLMEPSLHKYVTVRGMRAEMEPQESAGSNSFVGQPWASSWEANSVESTDRCWTSWSNNNEEVVEEQEPSDDPAHDSDDQGRRLRLRGSSSSSLPVAKTSSGKKR